MSDELADRSQGFAEAAHLVPGLLAHDDDRVPEGVHWRVVPPAGVLPAGPIVVRSWPGAIGEGERSVLSNRPDPFGEVGPGRELLVTVPRDPSGRTVACWLRVVGSGRLRVAVIADRLAPNGAPVELTARDEEPWIVASADLSRVRITGEGVVDDVLVHRVDRDAREPLGVLDVAALDPGLAEELVAYAVPLAGAEPPEDRVLRGAPRLPLPYAPRQPWPEYSEADELTRVLELVHGDRSVVDWLRLAYRAVADGAPGDILEQVGGGQQIRYPARAALGVAAADPGVARWLARAGMLRDRDPRWMPGEPALAVALMPVFRLSRIDSGFSPIDELYDAELGGGLAELRARARAFPSPRRDLRWQVELRQLPMPFVPEVPPAIPPTPSLALPDQAEWVTADGVADQALRTVAWKRRLAVREAAWFGPISLVRVRRQPTDPERETLHEVDGELASPLLLAWPQPGMPGTPPSGDSTLHPREPVASVEAAHGVRWEVRLEEWTGRWGGPATIDAEPPSPSRPTPPTIEALLLRSAVGGTGPSSPGTVHVTVTVARPTAPGALPLAALRVAIDGDEQTIPLPDVSSGNAVAVLDHPVPPSRPGERRELRFAAWVEDAAGQRSTPDAVAVVHADDARPVPPPLVSPRVIVAGRPGPAPEVTVSLTVRATLGAAFYRFYTAAEAIVRARVGLSGGFRELPRAERARVLLERGLPPRDGFTLAVTAAVDSATGRATGVLTLPSGTRDLVLVRAVPVTGGVDAYGTPAEGVEAPVASVAPVYLVVPSDEVPPLPIVVGRSPEGGRVEVSIQVGGVPAASLSRMPGPIEARLVEVVDGQDPRYWPEVSTLSLRPTVDGRFAGTVDLEVPEWSRLRFAASVRFAAEATVIPGAEIVDEPDLAAGGPQPDAVPAPWGPLSAPCSVDVAGAEPTLRTEPADAGVRVVVEGLPRVDAGSSAFTAIVYTGADALVEHERRAVSAGDDAFAVAAGPASVVLVDPFGGARPPVVVSTTP